MVVFIEQQSIFVVYAQVKGAEEEEEEETWRDSFI